MVRKKVIIAAVFNDDGTVSDFGVNREMTDDEFVLLFATLYGKSAKFAQLFNAVNKSLATLKAESKVREQYMNMLRNVSIIDTDTGEVLQEIPAGVE